MFWGSDLDGVAKLAKARHADMLEDAAQRQRLRRLLPGRTRRPSIWQRLRQIVLGAYLPERPGEAYPAHRSLQHG